jgi:hypothetical protein
MVGGRVSGSRRDGRRQGQRQQEAGDEEALVDLVAANHREHQLDADADREAGDEHRQEVERAVDETRRDFGGEVEAQRLEDPGLPAVERARAGRDRPMGLQPRVVHRHEHDGHQRDHDRDHHPFEVEPVADVNCPTVDIPGGEEQCVGRLVDRVEDLQLAAAIEMRLHSVQEVAQETHQPSFQISKRLRRSAGP